MLEKLNGDREKNERARTVEDVGKKKKGNVRNRHTGTSLGEAKTRGSKDGILYKKKKGISSQNVHRSISNDVNRGRRSPGAYAHPCSSTLAPPHDPNTTESGQNLTSQRPHAFPQRHREKNPDKPVPPEEDNKCSPDAVSSKMNPSTGLSSICSRSPIIPIFFD